MMPIALPYRVLFVDDERFVLDGIRRALRADRAEMELHFVESGADALRWLANEHCDVLVSDMRMPVMDGAVLFDEVARRHPAIIRILLSGQIDAAGPLRADRAAHRVLSKPISHTLLLTTIRELCTSHETPS